MAPTRTMPSVRRVLTWTPTYASAVEASDAPGSGAVG
jgi:hypothetical protein